MVGRSPTQARQTAHDVLMRVSANAAYGGRALDTALERGNLPVRDRALVTELVYGTLRHGGALDDRLRRYLAEPLNKLPPAVHVALQLGAYQILHTRVPARSAVNESVALVRKFGRLSGVVNAVLRRLAQNTTGYEAPTPQQHTITFADAIAELAVRSSHPAWLVEEVAQMLGQEGAAAWVAANNAAAPLALRVRGPKAWRSQVMAKLMAHGIDVRLHPYVDMSLEVRRGGKVSELPGFAEGIFTVQDPAASLVSLWANPQPGQTVLDVCAAPGGKSIHLAELMHDTGKVVALDIHPGKTRLVGAAAQRLHLTAVHPAVGDATSAACLRNILTAVRQAQGKNGAEADLVLVDAPCSGMGTLRRNPELRRCDRQRVASLAALQRRILDSAAEVVAPGGGLVYAVCTPTAEEGPEQIAAFCASHPHFELVTPPACLQPFAQGMFLRTWTHQHAMDSFFVAKLRRKPWQDAPLNGQQ